VNEKWVAKQKDTIESHNPEALYIDCETSYAVGKFWGHRTYNVDILDIIQDTRVIMVGFMKHSDKKAKSVCLKDFKGYKPGIFNINDRGVVEKAWELMNSHEVIIGQNSDKFDVPLLMARFWAYGMPAPKGFDQEDTRKRAKKAFFLASYKLNHMLKYRGLPQKKDAGGLGAWDAVIEEGKGWEKMGEYCRNDVEVLRPLWASMAGYGKNKTIANHFTRKLDHCPSVTCMSKEIRKNGPRPLASGWKQKWYCFDCGTPWTTDLHREDPKINISLIK